MLLYVHRNRKGYIEDEVPRTSTSTFTQLLSFETFRVCFTSKETIGTIRDGELWTSTSTFTQLVGSASFQDHSALRPQKRGGLLGTGTRGEGDERVKARPRIPPGLCLSLLVSTAEELIKSRLSRGSLVTAKNLLRLPTALPQRPKPDLGN